MSHTQSTGSQYWKKYTLLMGFLWVGLAPLLAQGTLPEWALSDNKTEVLTLSIPSDMQSELPQGGDLRYLVLNLEPDWAPDWQKAAFELKGLIVGAKTLGNKVKVGVRGPDATIDALLGHEMAAYFDGYLFRDEPFLPKADETGKLWQEAEVAENRVLGTLLDAASIGIEVVFFSGLTMTEQHTQLLKTIAQTPTGSLDLQPDLTNMDPDDARFFLDPRSGNYHLAVYGSTSEEQEPSFSLAKGMKVELLFPKEARFRHRQYGSRTELRLFGDSAYYFFLLEPGEKSGTNESIEIRRDAVVDPYELVVKNQVFKDREDQKFQSLEVDEFQNFTYAVPSGFDIDVTYEDTVIMRKGKPVERIRREFYLGGVKWRSDKMPDLPLIQPEKVQSVPLVVDLDKTYNYIYKGQEKVDGHLCWKVRFEPKQVGDFFAGTVWIDQETGAHRKLRAIQSGLEPPVIGNEVTAFFDWVEQDDMRYWTQVRENNLQLINIVGERITLQIEARRENFRFNRGEAVERDLAQAYAGNQTILRDTDKGFRYLKKKKDGKREVTEETFTSRKAVLGGVFFDPALDSPVPLAGFNYTNLDFLKRGYQANFFVAGAVNDIIVSNPNFLGKDWDLTAELFLTALYFGDSVYEGDEERLDLEVESLTESFNLTLGIPLNSFFKVGANYALRYLDYKEADDTAEDFVLPESHLEHIGRLSLDFSRKRFTSQLTYQFASRSDWEAFGLEGDSDGVEDTYSSLQFDMALSKRFAYFQSLGVETRYLKGWNMDRFSRFGFGFFENRVPGFGTSGITGDEAYRLSVEYGIGVQGLFSVDLDLTAARANLSEQVIIGGVTQAESVDLAGLGLAVNFMGPWQTLIRADVGYGFYSDQASEEGQVTGQIVFLKLF